MWPIPTPSHDLPADAWLVLVLLGLSPAMLASWMESRFRTSLARLPVDGYSLVLLAVAAGAYLAQGMTPWLLSPSLPLGTTVVVGLLAGVTAVGIDLSISRLWTAPQRRRAEAGPRWVPRVPADVPTGGDVVWRLRDHGPAWRSDFASLLAPAILEELVYRQALLVLLSQAAGVVAAAVVTTVSFGLIHLYFGVQAVVSKMIIGAVFVAIVLSGGGLLSVILGHTVLNATVYAVRTGRIRSPLVSGVRRVRV
jgi:membrane protease YdiL (CAAX protease family)